MWTLIREEVSWNGELFLHDLLGRVRGSMTLISILYSPKAIRAPHGRALGFRDATSAVILREDGVETDAGPPAELARVFG